MAMACDEYRAAVYMDPESATLAELSAWTRKTMSASGRSRRINAIIENKAWL